MSMANIWPGIMGAAGGGGAGPWTLNLAGGLGAIDIDFGARLYTAGMIISSNGELRNTANGSPESPINGTDWVRPLLPPIIVGSWECMVSNVVEPGIGGFNDNTNFFPGGWVNTAFGDLFLTMSYFIGGSEEISITFDLEIREILTPANTTGPVGYTITLEAF